MTSCSMNKISVIHWVLFLWLLCYKIFVPYWCKKSIQILFDRLTKSIFVKKSVFVLNNQYFYKVWVSNGFLHCFNIFVVMLFPVIFCYLLILHLNKIVCKNEWLDGRIHLVCKRNFVYITHATVFAYNIDF